MTTYEDDSMKTIGKTITLGFFSMALSLSAQANEVERDFAGRTVTFSNVNVNDTGVNTATVTPGAEVSITADWSSEFTGTFCPGCVQQFYIGVKDLAIDCLFSGNTAQDRSGDGSLNFTAPVRPGVYPIQARNSLQFSCTATEESIVDNVGNALGYIRVVDSKASVERSFAQREITFNNISLNKTGHDSLRVAPGALVSLNVDWSSRFTGDFCPGCIQQFYLGVKNVESECLFSGFTSTDQSDSGNLELFAPSTPGVYVIQAASSLDFSCTRTAESISDNASGAVASFEVVAE